jgi:hypothetical protein
MPRKRTTPAVVPTDAALDAVPAVELEQQASGTSAPESAPDPRAGKKYTAEQLVILNQLAASLLSGVNSQTMHQDALVNRAARAYEIAEFMLPIAQEIADREA